MNIPELFLQYTIVRELCTSEDGRFQDLAWNGSLGESILEFPGIGVQLIDHLPLIPTT
jgi:hypothetical protein